MHLNDILVLDQKNDTLLSAGELTVHITDWFFLKKNIELKYIGLKNAYILMNRSDSIWNYQFIVDYFSPSKPTTSKKKTGGMKLALKKMELENIRFLQKDGWRGQDIKAAFSKLYLLANKLSPDSKKIDIDYISVKEPDILLTSYKGKYEPLKVTETAGTDTSASSSINAGGLIVELKKLELGDGNFAMVNQKKPAPENGVFDANYMNWQNIHLSLNNLKLQGDTLTAAVDLKTKERSGLEVLQLKTNAKVTPQQMAFHELLIKTPKSYLTDYFAMKFDAFSSMADFIEEVTLESTLKDATIHSDDIAYFAPALKTTKRVIKISGNVRGPVSHIKGENMAVESGIGTKILCDISLAGLPDIETTFIDFSSKEFKTTYADAVSFVPALKKITQPDLKQLQYVHFNGNFTGFIKDFVAYGTIKTQLGAITTDLNMKLPNGKAPVYSGKIVTTGFNLGALLPGTGLGSVAMNVTAKGQGFNPATMYSRLDGTVQHFDYNGYRYTNLQIDGSLAKNRFEGKASINDSAAVAVFDGMIDFNDIPQFKLYTDIGSVNLKKLKLYNEDVEIKGQFNLDFTGKNIDDFLGSAVVSNATIIHNGQKLPFDSLVLTSALTENGKKLRAVSNEFDVNLTGNFHVNNLVPAMQKFLHKYYPSYIQPPAKSIGSDSLSFDIITYNIEPYIALFDTSITGLNHSHLYGNLNTITNELNLTAQVPQLLYKQYNMSGVELKAAGNSDHLTVNLKSDNIFVTDSINVPELNVFVFARNDTSSVEMQFGANKALDAAEINAQVFTFSNGVKVKFEPTQFVLNGKTWTVDDNGELEFRNNVAASGNLLLREGEQVIKVSTQPANGNNWNDLLVEMQKVNLGDFSPFILPNNRLEGLLTGNVVVKNPANPQMTVSSEDVFIQNLIFDNDTIGDFKGGFVYDDAAKKVTSNGEANTHTGNLAYKLQLYLANAEATKNNLIEVSTRTFDIKILERFLGTLFTDMKGTITGDFKLTGPLQDINIAGKGRLKDASLKVLFTQCYYNVEETDIEFTPTNINLNNIVLRDPVTNNPVYLMGDIRHKGFNEMFLDVTVSTLMPNSGVGSANNKPVLVLNTTAADKQPFYGKVFATGSFSLSGFTNDLQMQIAGIASSTDSSYITISSTASKASGLPDFMVEKKHGIEMSSMLQEAESLISFDVDVTANPMLKVMVLMDDVTGDKIEGRGTGSLNIRSNATEELAMRGHFDITDGKYDYTFQSLYKKPFTIIKGRDNFISWDGDPYNATINFAAQYTAANVSLQPLADYLDLNENTANSREDVYVIIKLNGKLLQPDLAFELDFPQNSRFKTDFNLASGIEILQRNPVESIKQAAFLVGLNSFIPPETNQGASLNIGSSLNELGYSTISSISSLLFNEINNRLNSQLSQLLKTDNLKINFNASVYNRNLVGTQSAGFGLNSSSINGNVAWALFNDRLVINFDGNFDVPLASTIQQTVAFLPDVNIDWLINPSGTVRATLFYRENMDFVTTSATGAARMRRYGLGFSYKKEFNSVKELFSKPKRPTRAIRYLPPDNDSIPEMHGQ